jgi:murein DD-endopeptidase MepM/ murein hydrolase activator NlpD
VQAVASGRVEFAGRKGGDGNMVKIAHANGYESMYMHLSRILVRRGAHVQQGERIGLVGMTGLATGPHLDFRMESRGNFINFERMKIPPSTPVARSLLPEFRTVRDQYVALLTSGNGTAVAQSAAPEAEGAVAAK